MPTSLTRYNSIDENDSNIDDSVLNEPRIPSHQWIQKFMAVLMIINTLLAVLLLLKPTPSLPQLSTIKSPIPQSSTQLKAFNADHRFSAPPNSVTDALWTDLIGTGHGFISVENPRKYNLSPGARWANTPLRFEMYGISMFHQLHCVYSLREFYWATVNNDTHHAHKGYSAEHLTHCFDYLRQGIMCAGDTTIEYPSDAHSKKIDGMNSVLHVCKNFNMIKAYVDTHQPV